MFSIRRTVRIEWGDCDPAGIVFYPRYFAMFNHSTVLLIEGALGVQASITLNQQHGLGGFPAVETQARFLLPTRYGDDVEIEIRVHPDRPFELRLQHRLTLARRAGGGRQRDPLLGDARRDAARRPARAADAGRRGCEVQSDRSLRQRYCGLIPSCFTTAASFALCSSIDFVKSAPVPGLTNWPVAVSRDETAGSATASLHVGCDAVAQCCRHVPRPEQAGEAVERQRREAGLRDRGRVRLRRRALAVGDRDQLDAAGLDVRLHDRERADIGLDAAFAEVGERRRPRRDMARA